MYFLPRLLEKLEGMRGCIPGSRYLLLADLGQSAEESREAGLGTQSHGCAWAFDGGVMGPWGRDVISFLLQRDHFGCSMEKDEKWRGREAGRAGWS